MTELFTMAVTTDQPPPPAGGARVLDPLAAADDHRHSGGHHGAHHHWHARVHGLGSGGGGHMWTSWRPRQVRLPGRRPGPLQVGRPGQHKKDLLDAAFAAAAGTLDCSPLPEPRRLGRTDRFRGRSEEEEGRDHRRGGAAGPHQRQLPGVGALRRVLRGAARGLSVAWAVCRLQMLRRG
ncbi:hypothetical protein PVAP13_2KG543200 [Panicum virgatum]|uniref:Uncharacterized protein n=1 Tax=Panicum virgatum TaxID=38727 RepID=A0A8T0WQH9_PANVG|nr:hypothetical protein PVAP13_2KG543200 [Panicum virgatum]